MVAVAWLTPCSGGLAYLLPSGHGNASANYGPRLTEILLSMISAALLTAAWRWQLRTYQSLGTPQPFARRGSLGRVRSQQAAVT